MNDYLSHGTSPLVTPSPRSLREKLSCQLFSHATLCILLDVAGRSQNTLSTFTQAYHDQPYYAAKRNTCLLLPNDGIPILLRRNNCPMLAGLLMLKPSWPPTLKTPTTIGCSAAANVCFGTCGVRRIPTERFQFPFKGRFFWGADVAYLCGCTNQYKSDLMTYSSSIWQNPPVHHRSDCSTQPDHA